MFYLYLHDTTHTLLGMTTRHRFLILMGGFHYFNDSGKSYSPAVQYQIAESVRKGKLELPTIEEIQDKTKDNPVTRLFVLIQTSWFITQCVSRGIESMHVTKLEILTMAYIMVNVSLFIAWWHKPRNVDCSIQVLTKIPPFSDHVSKPRDYIGYLADVMLGVYFDAIQSPNVKQVPIFYSGWPSNDEIFLATFISFLIGGIFAGINCIAWSYTTSSFTEIVLWRISSLAVFGLLLFGCISLLLHLCFFKSLKWHVSDSRRVMGRLILLSGLLYMAARIVSIVLAFMELKRPPSSTYDTISWIQSIPHI